MNGGAFGENFPYSNFHDLNMDWIIKIAKDFLDQYTHIQELIDNGEESITNLTNLSIEQLEEKTTTLKALLQEWYNTHSQDIALQLANAIGNFNTSADKKASDTIASIPDDYSTLSTNAIKSMGLCGYQGTTLRDANAAPYNSIYRIVNNDPTHYPANLPSTNLNGHYLITITSYVEYNDTGTKALHFQYILDYNLDAIYKRDRATGFGNDNWHAWTRVPYNPMINNQRFDIFFNGYSEANNIFDYMTRVEGKYVQYNDGIINTLASYAYVTIQVSANTSYQIANGDANAHIAFFSALPVGQSNYISGILPNRDTQFTTPANAAYMTYSFEFATYKTVWIGTSANYIAPSIKDSVKNNASALKSIGMVGYSGRAITDANDAEPNSIYFTANSESQYYISNLPENINGYLVTLTAPTSLNNMVFWYQTLFDSQFNALFTRRKVEGFGGTWDAWTQPKPATVVTVKKTSGGNFTKLTDALAYGLTHKNTTIYLDSGTYDIIEELGADYFENFHYAAYTNMGPKIGNGTHLICSSDSKIVCNYTGSNNDVITGFSPFNPVCESDAPNKCDFIIEGANIEVSNIRYCVHDDFSIVSIPAYHKYKNCNMKFNGQKQCIGGGLAKCATIEIENCFFNTTESNSIAVSYHNTDSHVHATNKIEITNCYLTGTDRFQFKTHGTHTEKTPVYVTGCSMGSAIEKTSTTGSADNIDIYEWNNIVR